MTHNPYAPPESKVESALEYVTDERPPRGGCLTTLLAVMFAGNVVMTGVYLLVVAGKWVQPGLRAWVGPTLFLVGVVNISSLVAIWNWRRWGFYVLVVSASTIFVMNMFLGMNPFKALAGLIGPVLIFALIKPMWRHFR